MAFWKGIVGDGFSPDEFETYVATVAFDSWRPRFIVLHNTAVPTRAQWHEASGTQRMRGLEHYYRDVQQWSAGPHLFVADDLIWVFTPLNVPGVHSPSWNAISWGVELVGDYAKEEFGSAIRDNAIRALATLHAALGLDPSTLRLHKEDPRTTHNCPGKNIVKDEVIGSVEDQLATVHAGEHTPANQELIAALRVPDHAPPTTKGKRADRKKNRGT